MAPVTTSHAVRTLLTEGGAPPSVSIKERKTSRTTGACVSTFMGMDEVESFLLFFQSSVGELNHEGLRSCSNHPVH